MLDNVALYDIILGIQIIIPELCDHLIEDGFMEGIWWADVPFLTFFIHDEGTHEK